jgi:outer membrane protein assembly factor BamA
VCHLKQSSNFAKSFTLGYGGVTLSTGLRTGIHIPILSKSYISDRFFLGGVDTFRGFEQRGIKNNGSNRGIMEVIEE